MNDQAHALYRFYADDGALLYVGITNNPSRRWSKHEDEKPWWHEVRGITVEPYSSREDVLAAEIRAIEVERPRYNIRRPSIGRAKRVNPIPLKSPQMEWLCDHCNQVIADGAGYVHISYRDIDEYETEYRAWKERNPGPVITGDQLLAMSEYAEWHAHHRDCDPRPETADYFFDVERGRSTEQILDWTLHMMEKDWLNSTDWRYFLYKRHATDPKRGRS